MTNEATPLGHRYLLHEVIGRGTMGEVRRATTRDTGEELAAKVLRPELATDEDVVARFVQERRILMRISSPNVVAVRDLVVEADTLAIVADLVRGPNLRTHLDASGTLAPAEAVAVAVDVLHGLAAAEALGVVHRDVKPENVLLDLTSPRPVAKLTDFGVARLAHGSVSNRMTALVGTVAYLAPELAEDTRATPAADVWSAGVLLYELLSGSTPFEAGNLLAMIKAARERDPAPPPGLPPDLWAEMASLLAKAPGRRPRAAAAAAALERLLPSLASLPPLPRVEAGLGVTGPVYGWGAVTPQEPPGLLGGTTVQSRHSPAIASAPVAPPPAPPGQGLLRAGRTRVLALAGGGAVLLLALVLGGFALANRSPDAVSQTFPPVLVGGTVSTQRTWHLAGDQLTAEVRLRNTGPVPADLSYDEVVPETVARQAGALRQIAPSGYQVVKQDPVLRWSFSQLAPAAVQTITYAATAGGTGSPRSRLARLVADQQREEAIYLAQAHIALRVLQALQVDPAGVTLTVGQSRPLTVTGTFDDGTPAPAGAFVPTFGSSNPVVVSVDGHGSVKALASGNVVVHVAVGSVSTDVPVSVAAVTAAPPPVRPRPSASTPAPTPTAKPSTSSPPPPPPSLQPTTPAAAPTTPAPPRVPHSLDDYGTGPTVEVAPNGVQATYWRGTDANLWVAVWDGTKWTGPASLGMGPMASEPTAGGANGQNFVYWKGTDGAMREGWFDGTKWNGPLTVFNTKLNSDPAVAVAPSGHHWIFWKGNNGHLFVLHWTGTTWDGPTDIGMGTLGSHPGASVNASEHPYVYWKGLDGGLWQAFFDGTKWNGPNPIAGVSLLGSAPEVSINPGGAQGVVWRGTDANYWAAVWIGTAGTAWSAPLKVMNATVASDICIGQDSSGHDWAYWRGSDNKAWGAYFDGTSWIGPVTIPQMGPFG